jgi:hypothetical protein
VRSQVTSDVCHSLPVHGDGIVATQSPDDVNQLAQRLACAVVVRNEVQQWWAEVESAIGAGQLTIRRTILPAISVPELRDWAYATTATLNPSTASALSEDIVSIARHVTEISGTDLVSVRIFTEAPTRRCGFHVDTVPVHAPPIGALRVYNGVTTEYVMPADVLGMGEFYRYLARRERLSRELDRLDIGYDRAVASLIEMDEAPSFLRDGATIRRVPSGATVFFKHVDVSRMWSPHPVSDCWIHRSPMRGKLRLVLNVAPTRPSRLTSRRREGHG